MSMSVIKKPSQPLIKYKEVKLENITIGALGYTSIAGYIPTGMNNFLFCLMWTFGKVTNTSSAFGVNADGIYIYGTPGANLDYIKLRYYYTD